MLILPEQYIVQKFYQYNGAPLYNKYNNTYQASCGICKEGKSFLKKRRCYYIPAKQLIYCHNCGWSSKPLEWIKNVSNLSIIDIHNEIKEYEYQIIDMTPPQKLVNNTEVLPEDCINLFDNRQITHYQDNTIVKNCIEFVQHRRLNTAVNKPSAFYLSLTDSLHKNRLIIPFFDTHGKIVHYQSRAIYSADKKARYISKLNSEKTIFNFNNITPSTSNIFLFEGPLNSCFVTNGVGVGGIQEKSQELFSHKQKTQLLQLSFYERIWVLDSQWLDSASANKCLILAEQNEKIFIWPEEIGKVYKDFNEWCITENKNSIDSSFITENTHQGLKARLLLQKIKGSLY